jgi:hypothetical protein
MKITINTDILRKHGLSLGDFLVLLMGYYGASFTKCYQNLREKDIVEPNIFEETSLVLSNNSKNLVARILMECEEKAVKSGIDFEELAKKLCALYPTGTKPGTTYLWQEPPEDIAQKLRVLYVKFNFEFTEQEAITAVKEYVDSFEDLKNMRLLRNFLLCAKKNSEDNVGVESQFMTIVENNRMK